MMSDIDDGGPAFGNVISLECVRVEMTGEMEYEPKVQGGNLTVRDYLAAHALPTFASIEYALNAAGVIYDNQVQTIAACAYKLADAMLEARKK